MIVEKLKGYLVNKNSKQEVKVSMIYKEGNNNYLRIVGKLVGISTDDGVNEDVCIFAEYDGTQ